MAYGAVSIKSLIVSPTLAQATLYVPYWIVNKTGLWLSLKQVGMGTLPIRCAMYCMHLFIKLSPYTSPRATHPAVAWLTTRLCCFPM